jgi:DNA-binding IclR family transcriptional regulator
MSKTTKATNNHNAQVATAKQPSKKDQVIALLRRESGASLDEMTSATGWLPHTTRAMLTGLRKLGYTLTKETVDGTTRYTISSESAA